MARSRVKRFQTTDFSGGINQFEELARRNQVADALNLWAPDGQAETRPGLALLLDGVITSGTADYRIVGFERATMNGGFNDLALVVGDFPVVIYPYLKNLTNSSELDLLAPINFLDTIPPSLAVIPEFNTSFMAFNGTVYECALNAAPVVAQIETRDEIVYKVAGVKSPYYDGRDGDVVSAPNAPGYVPQLTAFPAADFILYHQGQLFLAERGKSTLRWGAPAQDGAHKVFPAYAFENISSDNDSSGITALAAFQENVVVFQENSIWLATYSGLNFLDLPKYKLVRVVSGVGCVAHDAISYLNDGRLVFPAKDGVYAFNGATVEKLSREIDNEYARINASRRHSMSGTSWHAKNTYLVAVPIGDATYNTRILAYDSKRNAWWFWDVIGAQAINKIVDNTAAEVITVAASSAAVDHGKIFTLSPNTVDDGDIAIPTELTTWRIGDDGMVKTYRSIRVNADQVVNDITVEATFSDEDPVSWGLNFESEAESKFGTAVWGTSTFSITRRRERRLDIRRTGRWMIVKLSSAVKTATRFWSLATEAIVEGLR